MNPIVDEVKKEYRSKVNFEYVSMDNKAGEERAAEYGVLGYPNLLILDSNGEQYSLLKGVVVKETIAGTLDNLLAQEE